MKLWKENLSYAINEWQAQHLNKAALSRIRLLKSGATIATDAVVVTFPNGEKRMLRDHLVLLQKLLSRFLRPIFLKHRQYSGCRSQVIKSLLVTKDKALGLKIDASKALPDIIIVDQVMIEPGKICLLSSLK
jgi:hypothetical protein